MPDFATTQPDLAGSTLYAVLSRAAVPLATVPMAEGPPGTFSGSVPPDVPIGPLTVEAYLGRDPGPDWRVAAGVVDWTPPAPPPPPPPPLPDRTRFGVVPRRHGFAGAIRAAGEE